MVKVEIFGRSNSCEGVFRGDDVLVSDLRTLLQISCPLNSEIKKIEKSFFKNLVLFYNRGLWCVCVCVKCGVKVRQPRLNTRISINQIGRQVMKMRVLELISFLFVVSVVAVQAFFPNMNNVSGGEDGICPFDPFTKACAGNVQCVNASVYNFVPVPGPADDVQINNTNCLNFPGCQPWAGQDALDCRKPGGLLPPWARGWKDNRPVFD